MLLHCVDLLEELSVGGIHLARECVLIGTHIHAVLIEQDLQRDRVMGGIVGQHALIYHMSAVLGRLGSPSSGRLTDPMTSGRQGSEQGWPIPKPCRRERLRYVGRHLLRHSPGGRGALRPLRCISRPRFIPLGILSRCRPRGLAMDTTLKALERASTPAPNSATVSPPGHCASGNGQSYGVGCCIRVRPVRWTPSVAGCSVSARGLRTCG